MLAVAAEADVVTDTLQAAVPEAQRAVAAAITQCLGCHACRV